MTGRSSRAQSAGGAPAPTGAPADAPARREPVAGGAPAGRAAPVARVLVDTAAAPRPPVRLPRARRAWTPTARARRAGCGCGSPAQLVDGVRARSAWRGSDHPGRLASLERVRLARAGAHPRGRRGSRGRSPTATPGTLADVLRLAVPPRHARAEAEPAPAPRAAAAPAPPDRPAPAGWDALPGRAGVPRGALADGRAPARGLDRAARAGWPRELAPPWPAAPSASGAARSVVVPDGAATSPGSTRR